MAYRGHEPVRIKEFNGLYRRGQSDSCPIDHFTDCDNITYYPQGFRTRDGLSVVTFGVDSLTINNIVRVYTYVAQGVESLLVLDTLGNIFHTANPIDPFAPILTIAGMTDFAFVGIAGRAYISPHDGRTGLEGEFLYVYLGDGTVARKAAGAGPVGSTLVAALGTPPGHVEEGYHVFGVVYETNTGFLTQIGPDTLATIQGTDAHPIDLSGIPVSPDSFVVARHIVASKSISPVSYTGNPNEYELFFVPGARIDDNTTTVLAGIDFYDADLLQSASRLEDLFSEIAAGVCLNTYHNRLVLGGQFGEYNANPDLDTLALESTFRISNQGEPEAIDQVDGLVVVPQDGNPVTNAQEYRDILYLFKKTRTFAVNDNGDVPSTWVPLTLDQGSGASVHGIATVLDSGGVNVDYLIIANFTGICLFNGSFIKPELSWKIETYWMDLDQDEFDNIQMVNDPISKQIFLTLQTDKILFGDYSEGLDQMKIKWGLWSFANQTTSIAILDTNRLIIASREEA